MEIQVNKTHTRENSFLNEDIEHKVKYLNDIQEKIDYCEEYTFQGDMYFAFIPLVKKCSVKCMNYITGKKWDEFSEGLGKGRRKKWWLLLKFNYAVKWQTLTMVILIKLMFSPDVQKRKTDVFMSTVNFFAFFSHQME